MHLSWAYLFLALAVYLSAWVQREVCIALRLTLLYCHTLQRRNKWIKKDINNTSHLQLSQTLCRGWTVVGLGQSYSHYWGLNLGTALPAAEIPAAWSGSETLGFAFPQILFVEIVLNIFLFHQEWFHCGLWVVMFLFLMLQHTRTIWENAKCITMGKNNP